MNTLCGDRRKAKDNPSIPRSSRATDISEYRVTALTPSYQRSFGRKRRTQALSLTGMATTLPLKRASSPFDGSLSPGSNGLLVYTSSELLAVMSKDGMAVPRVALIQSRERCAAMPKG